MKSSLTGEADGPSREDQISVRRASLLALASIAGTLYFALSVVALHLLRPDYDPTMRAVSEFAVGPYGYFMTVAFFAIGLGMLALAFGISPVSPPSRSSKAGRILVALCGAGVVVAGIFPTDVSDSITTTSGAIHQAASGFSFLP